MSAKSLRILVVLPMYGGSLPIGRYCARAMIELGHTVQIFEAPELYPAFTGLARLDLPPSRRPPLENSFLQVVSQAVWAQTENFAPDFVLALAQAPLSRQILLRMRRAGIRTAMWFVEDYRIFGYWRAYAPLYDIFAVIQKEPFLSELAKIGQEHAIYLPLAALPGFHKKQNLSPQEQKEYGSDVAFLGAGYPNRRLAFRPLANRNFKIWGSDWDGEVALAANIQRGGERISEDESVKIYSATKINLNLHSSLQVDNLVSGGDFVNPRTFELAAMGAFQLVDNRKLLSELFSEDELATFDDLDGMYAAIEHYLAKPEERLKISERARKRVLIDHTYQKRMQALLEYAESNIAPWQNAREPARYMANLPRDLEHSLEELFKKVGLAPGASFEDLMEALRKQSGELDELETSLLFLDEWKKLYKN